MKLEHALYVPCFHLNFISGKFTKALNCCIVLLPNGCILQDLATGRMIGSGEQRGDLYYMKPSKTLPDSFHVPATQIFGI